MTFRAARILAAGALVLSVAGSFPAALGLGADGRLLWVFVPVLSSAGVFLLVPRRSPETVWALTGMCWGFAVLAMLSVGLFFAPSALLLLIAAIVHSLAVRATWRSVLIPAWFVAGVTSVCILFLARDQVLTPSRHGSITAAPAIVFGGKVFAGLAVFLGLATPIVFWLERGRADQSADSAR